MRVVVDHTHAGGQRLGGIFPFGCVFEQADQHGDVGHPGMTVFTDAHGNIVVGTEVLRVFACGPDGRVVFDSARRDTGQVYGWTMTGGGRNASENYTVVNMAEVGNELRVAAPVRRARRLRRDRLPDRDPHPRVASPVRSREGRRAVAQLG